MDWGAALFGDEAEATETSVVAESKSAPEDLLAPATIADHREQDPEPVDVDAFDSAMATALGTAAGLVAIEGGAERSNGATVDEVLTVVASMSSLEAPHIPFADDDEIESVEESVSAFDMVVLEPAYEDPYVDDDETEYGTTSEQTTAPDFATELELDDVTVTELETAAAETEAAMAEARTTVQPELMQIPTTDPEGTHPINAFYATFESDAFTDSTELSEEIARLTPGSPSNIGDLDDGLIVGPPHGLPPLIAAPPPRPSPLVSPPPLAPPPVGPPPLDVALAARQPRFRATPVISLGPKSKHVLGIDLGTTYSCAAVAIDGLPKVIPARTGGVTVPSVVRYLASGKKVVGHSAMRNVASNAERTIIGSKRLMGRAFTSPAVQEVQQHFAYAMVPGRDGEAAIRVDDEIIGLEDVAATILQEIRESVALQVDTTINRAVITCPAHFTDRQREAVRTAGELAGFHVERVLNEPTAAALNYAQGRELGRRRMLVYDLGGGTFDVSALEVDGDVFEVLATGGDTFLGGLDFDACIVEVLAEAFLEAEHIDPREDPAAIAKLFEFAERAKRDLSDAPVVDVEIDHLVVQPYAARSLSVTLRRARLEQMFEPLVSQTIEIVRDVVARAKLSLDEVDDIVLVGGQSRAPIVRRAVKELFGREPLDRVDPEEAVALGAARYAASIDSIDSIVLIDALPVSIGVGLIGGRFKKLLERDTRLPSKRTYQVRTTKDDQKVYELAIFQGESEQVFENEPLGILMLERLPRGPRGSIVIEVTLTVNTECVLEVQAREMSTGREVSARMVTKDTPEELRVSLGLPALPTHEELEQRRQAFHNRPKGVWRWITGLFGRR